MRVGEGKQLIRTNEPHLYVADRVPRYDVPRWSGVIKDVRDLVDLGAVAAPTRTKSP